MGLQGSGAIRLSQIRNELSSINGSYSLRSLSSSAGKGTPDAMSEFFGYSLATPVTVTVHEPDGGFWAPSYDPYGNYAGGWYGDHYAWIYNESTGYQDTLTFGGTNNYSFMSGQSIVITSYFGSISWDTGYNMTYQAYVSNGSYDVANAITSIGGNAEAVYRFTTAMNTNYYFISFVRNIS